MGIYDMFSSKAAPIAPANNVASTAAAPNPPVPANSGVPANPPAPPNGQMSGTAQVPPNPLDSYKDLFQNKPDDKAPVAPVFSLDPAVVAKAAGQLDFIKDAPPELMARVNAGEAAAITELMNFSNRNAYQTAVAHLSNLTGQFVDARLSFDKTTLSGDLKRELTTQAVANSPNFQHPVVRAEVVRLAEAFAKQNPDATPQQNVDSAQKYMTDLHNAMNPAAAKDPNSDQATGGQDWEKYIRS